jgi:hypothetical protein
VSEERMSTSIARTTEERSMSEIESLYLEYLALEDARRWGKVSQSIVDKAKAKYENAIVTASQRQLKDRLAA